MVAPAGRRPSLTYGIRDVIAVYMKSQGHCGICGNPVTAQEASIDHIIPVSRDGEHHLDNWQLAHFRCNSSKSNNHHSPLPPPETTDWDAVAKMNGDLRAKNKQLKSELATARYEAERARSAQKATTEALYKLDLQFRELQLRHDRALREFCWEKWNMRPKYKHDTTRYEHEVIAQFDSILTQTNRVDENELLERHLQEMELAFGDGDA